MSLLDPITVLQALPVMGKAVGLKVDEDKPEIMDYLNKYRLLLYTMYEQFKLFDNVFHCLEITRFKQNCVDKCDNHYSGFTLPNDVLSVEAVWDYGKPLTLHSRWRESHSGVGIAGCKRVHAVEMAETFPTERDIRKCTALKIFTEREEDAGKCVHIEILNAQGRPQTLVFKLISDGWAVSSVVVKKILSVSLPSDRLGAVTLAQRGDGYELSRYPPWESIPNYRRFKVADNCCNGTILVQGVKRFSKIYHDHDIVEVGNDLIIEAAGNYFKFGDNTVDGNEINRSDKDLGKMSALLNGLISRHRGGAIQDGPVPIRTIRRKALPGYRK